MKTGLILLAGGSSERFQVKGSPKTAKLLMPISGEKTVLEQSFEQFTQALDYDFLCIVSHPEWQKPYQALLETHPAYDAAKTQWVQGGETRRTSVLNGLTALKNKDIDIVLIHDAARPLVTPQAIQHLFQALQDKTILGASLGRPSQDSLKRVSRAEHVAKKHFKSHWPSAMLNEAISKDNQVIESIPRENIWQVHTPQGFQFAALWQAHQSVPLDDSITDDMMLLEHAGLGPTTMVLDEASNIKLTNAEDLRLIQALYS